MAKSFRDNPCCVVNWQLLRRAISFRTVVVAARHLMAALVVQAVMVASRHRPNPEDSSRLRLPRLPNYPG